MWQNTIICKDKKQFHYGEARKKLTAALRRNYYYLYAEWQYKNIKPCIIAEKYMHEQEEGEIRDYKIQCFSGKPYCCRVDFGRFSDHRRNIYDTKWKQLNWQKGNYKTTDFKVEKPEVYDEMLNIASILSEGLRQVRVDLYEVNGKVYFSEMTFSSGGGFERFVPQEYDEIIGDMWNID